jgi:hypothetical protein
MKLAWKDTLLGAILYDSETGMIIGEISESEIGGTSQRRHHAQFRGESAGAFISREHARRAIEAAASKIEGQGAPP